MEGVENLEGCAAAILVVVVRERRWRGLMDGWLSLGIMLGRWKLRESLERIMNHAKGVAVEIG